MALPSILPRQSFADRLPLEEVTFVQMFQQQRSATGGGDTGYADRAPSLWAAECKTGPLENADAEALMALINSRAGGLKTVLLFNPKLPYPRTDTQGQIIGSVAPTINVITDRLHCSFAGFPPGYEIPVGTYFSALFDQSRYYLGQFVESRTANPITGAVASVEFWPPLPASIQSGTAITVAKPCGKFRIKPGSAFPATFGALHSTIQFSAEQTYSR